MSDPLKNLRGFYRVTQYVATVILFATAHFLQGQLQGMTQLPCPWVGSSECFPQRIPHSSYALGVIPASMFSPDPIGSRYTAGVQGERWGISPIFNSQLKPCHTLSQRVVFRGGFTDPAGHTTIRLIFRGGQSITFSFSIRGLLRGGFDPTIVLQCCRRGFRRTPTNHTNGGPPSLPPLRP